MALAPREFLAARLARVRALMALAGADALVVTHLPNVFYLTNFSGTAAAAVITADSLLFITDFRYIFAAESLLLSDTGCPGATLVRVQRSYDETLVEVLASGVARAIGVEGAHLPVRRYSWLAATLAHRRPGAALVQTDRLVERVRRCKDAHEIATLRRAGRLLSAVAATVLEEVRVGRAEREIAADIDWTIRRAGFERPAFETIVASGPNSAQPHARPGDRRLEQGDLVVLDFGGTYDGYCVDLTRTVSMGEPDGEACRLLEAVTDAQVAAIAAVRPGVRPAEVDAAARGRLEAHGLADAFGHGTGHGLGVEVHEEPRITQRDQLEQGPDRSDAADDPNAPLEVGMVFTIEPGAYVPGRGGVRIEDDVLVTETGCELLTSTARAFLVR